MGGYGSTRWSGYRGRTLVESCKVLDLNQLFRDQAIRPEIFSTNQVTWTRDGEPIASIGIKSEVGLTSGSIVLIFTVTQGTKRHDVRVRVSLETTEIVSGGRRWWFRCPAHKNGVSCNRRCLKLYLPPESEVFACRKCWELAYRSNRESGKWDSFLFRMARMTGLSDLSPERIKLLDRMMTR
jgi:hypothetical protein